MCGLVMIYSKNSDDIDFERFTKDLITIQKHRGPDHIDFMTWEPFPGTRIGMGHTLLSIVNSVNNYQPMSSSLNEFSIIYSGEIYNYKELRSQLDYSFQSETDTEVLLALYQKYGADMLTLIKGMYCFIIYDRKKNKLFIARDKYGQKPLYYWANKDIMIMSTEIKSILKCSEYQPSVNRDSAIQYFLMMDTFNWETMFKGIKIFPPGKYAYLNIDSGSFDMQEYAFPRFCTEYTQNNSLTEYEDRLRILLEKSVSCHSTPHLEWAIPLSGGIDSNTLAALAANANYRNVTAYTCAYQIAKEYKIRWDESEFAVNSANSLGLPINTVTLTPNQYLDELPKLVRVLEEPRGNSCMAQYSLIQGIAKSNCRVIWGGEGADELLAGYYWRYPKLLNISKDNEMEATWQLCRSVSHSSHKNLVLLQDWDYTKQIFYTAYDSCIDKNTSHSVPLNNFMAFQIRHYLHFLLLQSDKLVSNVGIEGRFPFLDYDLSNYILSLPLSVRYQQRSILAKPLLRQAMANLVPLEIIQRQKQGFVSPEAFWYRNHLQPLVQKWIFSSKSCYREYLNDTVVHNIINLHMNEQIDASKLIWGIIFFEVWHKIFIENQDI